MNQIDDEDTPQRSERKFSDYLAAAKRRRKPILITFIAGVVAAVTLAILLPSRYQSTGTILIEQQEMPSDLVRSTVTSYADQRVQVISQRVMTTQNLLSIMHRYDLYLHEQSREPREKLIQRMRDDIQFKMVSADVVDPRSGAPRKATIAFTVAYTSGMPDTAAKVANELTTLYLNENLTERTRLAQDAYGFLQSEGDRLNVLLQETDAKIAAFKEQHYQELPELAQLNMQQLDRAEQELRDAQLRRTTLDQQLMFLTTQFAQLKPESAIFSDTGERIQSPSDRLKALRAKLASETALYSPDHPDVLRMKREIAGLEAQAGSHSEPPTNELRRKLEQTRGELAEVSKKYSPDHPDVQRLQRQVTQLETELAKIPQQQGGNDNFAPAGTAAVAQGTSPGSVVAPSENGTPAQKGTLAQDPASTHGLPAAGLDASAGATVPAQSAAPSISAPPVPAAVSDNPAYIQVAAQLDSVRNDIAAQDVLVARVKAKIAEYEHKISLSPQVEKQFRELTREFESGQLRYREIRAKQMEAQVAQNLESDRKGERFTLIEPPLPPEDPISPNRPLILSLGLVVSLVLGAGAAAFLEATDATVRGRKDVADAFDVPMLAVVPRIVTLADIALGRRRLKYAVATVAVVGIGATAAVHFLYRPLDVLWFAAMRHIG
jgi:succinoglycan biosynthesis transport protein ExoP